MREQAEGGGGGSSRSCKLPVRLQAVPPHSREVNEHQHGEGGGRAASPDGLFSVAHNGDLLPPCRLSIEEQCDEGAPIKASKHRQPQRLGWSAGAEAKLASCSLRRCLRWTGSDWRRGSRARDAWAARPDGNCGQFKEVPGGSVAAAARQRRGTHMAAALLLSAARETACAGNLANDQCHQRFLCT